jgi:hypothetical protein
MARTLEEIRQEIIDQKANEPDLAGLTSTATTAIWMLWAYIVAYAIWVHEQLWELFKVEVEDIAARAIPGTTPWYAWIAKDFRIASSLVWNPQTGRYEWVNTIGTLQPVKLSSAREASGGVVYVKVATLDSAGVPVPLSQAEETAFPAYMGRIKFAGTNVQVINETADLLKLELEILYDGIVLQQTIESRVEAAILDYIRGLPFDGVFRIIHLVDAIQEAEGVVDVQVNSVEARYLSFPFVTVTREYATWAGYLAIDPAFPLANTITYTAVI